MEAIKTVLIVLGILLAIGIAWYLFGQGACDPMYRAGRDCMG